MNRLAIALCVACLLAMLAISFVGFLYMALTGAALSWTYSLARLFIPWIGMLSITVAFKSGEHVAMALLTRVVPTALRNLMLHATLGAIALFAGLLLWFGWSFFVGSTQHYMVSDQIQVHARWVAACMPLTGLILLLHLAAGKALLEPAGEAAAAADRAGER